MLRFSKFSQREKQARKWTFVRDWENEPTPSESDFRTAVSPRAEIITSPPPEVVSLPGGRQIIRGSPVPVLLNTSLSPNRRSTRKTQGRQLKENSLDVEKTHRSVHQVSGNNRSKRDNSVDEPADLLVDDDSTQNNPGSESDVSMDEPEAPVAGSIKQLSPVTGAGSKQLAPVAGAGSKQLTTRNRSEEVERVGGRLVGVTEFRDSSWGEGDSEAQRGTRTRAVNLNHTHIASRISSMKRSDNSVYTEDSWNTSTRKLSLEKRVAHQTSRVDKRTAHSSVKKIKQNPPPDTAVNQSEIQLAIETPVPQIKKKLVKPRVILAGSVQADKKKKKKIRDKSSELTIQMWVGRDDSRRKKDVVDLDVILHGITETLNKCREEFTEKPQQRALSKFVSHITADIVTEIESRQNVEQMNSNVKKSKKNVQALRKELQGLQSRKDSLLQKIEKAETESSTCDISHWMFGFQKFIKKNKALMTQLSTIEEEDYVKVV